MSMISHLNNFTKDFNLYAKKNLLGYKNGSLIWKAMNYGVINGGKRIRPFLVKEFSKILKLKKNNYMRLALAVELVHAYSLIHDDLPSMDDDELRRGKPTTHKKFGEGIAILAGNSLLTLAFEILSDKRTHNDYKIKLKLISTLSQISGFQGLAGGQALDLFYENKKLSKKKLIEIHKLKTAKLFEFCLTAPLIMSDNYTITAWNQAKRFGNNFGLIFQATDDLIDYKSQKSSKKLKMKQNNANILNHINSVDVTNYCKNLAVDATANSSLFSNSKNPLNGLIFEIIQRKL